jgi:hypothetical protein
VARKILPLFTRLRTACSHHNRIGIPRPELARIAADAKSLLDGRADPILTEKLGPVFDEVRKQSQVHPAAFSKTSLIMARSNGLRLLDDWEPGCTGLKIGRGTPGPKVAGNAKTEAVSSDRVREPAPSPAKTHVQPNAKTVRRVYDTPDSDDWDKIVPSKRLDELGEKFNELADKHDELAESLEAWAEALEDVGLEVFEFETGGAMVEVTDREKFDKWVKEEQAESASLAAEDPEMAARLEQHAQQIDAALDRRDAAEARIAEADKEWKEASVELAKFSHEVSGALPRAGLTLNEGEEVSIIVDDREKALEWFNGALDSPPDASQEEITPHYRETDSRESETPPAVSVPATEPQQERGPSA